MSQLSPVLPSRLASCPSLWVSAPCHSCAPAPLHSRAGTSCSLSPCSSPWLCAGSAGVLRGAAEGMRLHRLRWERGRELGSKMLLCPSPAGMCWPRCWFCEPARQEWREPLTCPLGVGVERLGSRLSSCQGPSCEHPTVLQDLADLTPLGLHSPHGSTARSLWAAPALLPPRATLVPAPATPLPQPSPLSTQDLAPFC